MAGAVRVLVRARHLGVRGQRWGKPHQVLSANHLPPNILPQSQFVTFEKSKRQKDKKTKRQKGKKKDKKTKRRKDKRQKTKTKKRV